MVRDKDKLATDHPTHSGGTGSIGILIKLLLETEMIYRTNGVPQDKFS